MSQGGEVQLTMRGINKRMITKSGGIELIVTGMLKFSDDLELLENACAALCNLMASRHDTKVRAARSGCIRAVVTSMRNFPREPELAQLACAVLRSLALGVPENKIAIVAQGGVRQLCEAMARHRGDVDVSIQAIAALCNLTAQLAENKCAICEAGGLEMTVAALQAHPGSEELQQQGCGLLHNLACERTLRLQVAAAGGLQVAAAAMQHSSRSVCSLGQMLQRQLQTPTEEEAGPTNSAGQSSVVGTRTSGALGEAGVEDLFAPRHQGVRAARSKALTRPQRKVMADVMESMRRDPRAWIPTEESLAGSDRRSPQQSEVSSNAGGAWDAQRQRQAAMYGIEDLEGLSSDAGSDPAADGGFDFVVRRGLQRQASRGGSAQKPSSSRWIASQLDADMGQDSLRGEDFPKELPEGIEEPGQHAAKSLEASPKFLPLTEANLKQVLRETDKAMGAVTPKEKQAEDLPAMVMASTAKMQQQATDDARSVSEASEGGWVDLEDETATQRLQRRARRELRHQRALEKPESEGAAALRELLGEVELEAVEMPPEAKQPKLERSASKFAKALKACGDAPPERWGYAWEQALNAKYEESQHGVMERVAKTLAKDARGMASSVLDSLDGLAAMSKMPTRLDIKKKLADAKTLAGRVKQDGLVHVVQSSQLVRRYHYGLEDDEESIFGFEDLRELGQAELALLDALGDANAAAEQRAAEEAEGQSETRRPERKAMAASRVPLRDVNPAGREAARLEALSQRLEQRRTEHRRVKLL